MSKQTSLTSLATKLISFRSITPEHDGIFEYISHYLENLGFEVVMKSFVDVAEGSKETCNLYAELKTRGVRNNFCFAGHVDVVHPGKEYKWTYPPFEPQIDNNVLYGRGAVDMKGSIACFLQAVSEFLQASPAMYESDSTVSLLLTADEEGDGINGTKKMLEYITERGYKITECVVGEPTSSLQIGDTVKIGRRGSVSFTMEIEGKQGHIAYPQNFYNPITKLAEIITTLKNYKFDEGNEFFDPSNLEVTVLECQNATVNVVPQSALCKFNVRFNDLHTSSLVVQQVRGLIESAVVGTSFKYSLKFSVSGESFISSSASVLVGHLREAIKTVTGQDTVLSTSGGTSDARFIKNYCNVVECGLLNKTAHQIDENVPVQHLNTLKDIYFVLLQKYFGGK